MPLIKHLYIQNTNIAESMNYLHFRNYSWVPIIGPHVGAILGAFLYQLTVAVHHPDNEDEYELPQMPAFEKVENAYAVSGMGNYIKSISN